MLQQRLSAEHDSDDLTMIAATHFTTLSVAVDIVCCESTHYECSSSSDMMLQQRLSAEHDSDDLTMIAATHFTTLSAVDDTVHSERSHCECSSSSDVKHRQLVNRIVLC